VHIVKKTLLSISIAIMAVGLIAALSGPATAKVTGPCYNCHTMHNSQGGSPMASDTYGTPPYGSLLVDACVGCHSSSESSTYYVLDGCKVPVVYYTGSEEPGTYLAGGNFWWVKEGKGGDDTKGHNVFFEEDDQELISGAPGGLSCGNRNDCHHNLSRPDETGGWDEGFKGRYGCQGCHLYIKHHASDHLNGQGGLVTTGEQGWYRFLARHRDDISHGVWGYEDDDWEAGHPNLSQGSTDHNEYRGNETGGMGLFNNPTTTGFCTGCHGDFHIQESGGNWIRHPSDAVVGRDDGPEEYKQVGGDDHLYDTLSPVARPSLPDAPTGNVTPGTDMVMCLSCHRPHATPYPDILRWDYGATQAQGGGADTGCFYCHTQKNNPG